MKSPPVRVRIWGDWACFTRPEFKVERVSYPLITPSAARGALEAIFWKPEFTWRIRRIAVLNRGAFFPIQRNEVTGRMTSRSNGIDISEARTQRHTLALRGVDYVIEADVELRDGSRYDEAKYRDQFRRRVARGQCFHRPYLGCREFAAMFAEPSVDERADVEWTEDLGLMLLDIERGEDGPKPHFFEARIESGILEVPEVRFNRKEAEDAAAAPHC